jgi:nitroimidazol reductase NimA-like FMN-containing flavoprotein (pyridoxamine 5'-phosphate oxidase superfamily)
MLCEMRRKEKQLSIEDTTAILRQAEYGILSTMGADGYPYGVPVSFVYHNRSIYFHCAKDGHKLNNIDNNCRVSFCAVIDVELMPGSFNTKFKSVIAFGKVKEVYEQEKRDGLMALLQKLSRDYLEAGEKYVEKSWDQVRVLKIEIEHLAGKGKA